nr:transposase [Streptomyces spinoverrucosus]
MTTKIHLAVGQGQKPLSALITAGQRGDAPQFESDLDAIRVPRIVSDRPRRRPDRVRADKAYDSRRTPVLPAKTWYRGDHFGPGGPSP